MDFQGYLVFGPLYGAMKTFKFSRDNWKLTDRCRWW